MRISELINFRRIDAFLTGEPLMQTIWKAHMEYRSKANLSPIIYDDDLGEIISYVCYKTNILLQP